MYVARNMSSMRMTLGKARVGGMFRIKYKMQMSFFDRNIIRTKWPAFNRDPLMHAGNLVMKIARGSIRRRKKARGKPSRAGSPPFSRQPGGTPPFKQIFSVPRRLNTTVIVGMVGYNFVNPVPGLHEHGGQAQRFVYTNEGQKRRKSGRWGKKRVSYKRKTIRYPKRPFMWPALLRARSRLPHLWKHSISRG